MRWYSRLWKRYVFWISFRISSWISVSVFVPERSTYWYNPTFSVFVPAPWVREGSGKVSRVDGDLFEKEIRLVNETNTEEVRVSYVNRKVLDQLEEWMKEKPIPYISNDKFSQEIIFQYWSGCLSGDAHDRLMSTRHTLTS
jgi:hypothetical protein